MNDLLTTPNWQVHRGNGRDMAIRMMLPDRVKARIDDAGCCVSLQYREYEEPFLVGALERIAEEIRRGPRENRTY